LKGEELGDERSFLIIGIEWAEVSFLDLLDPISS
jgi:hypothetical protein